MIEILPYFFATMSGYKLYRSCFGHSIKTVMKGKHIHYQILPSLESELHMRKVQIIYMDDFEDQDSKYKWSSCYIPGEPLFSEYYFIRIINTSKRSPFMFLIFMISIFYIIIEQII